MVKFMVSQYRDRLPVCILGVFADHVNLRKFHGQIPYFVSDIGTFVVEYAESGRMDNAEREKECPRTAP